jgi:hypothetical protein
MDFLFDPFWLPDHGASIGEERGLLKTGETVVH